MIKEVKIKNFESHHKTDLEFCDGINLIIGSTDSGKSSVIKAMDFVINNKLTGDKFITHEKENCSVSVFDENNEVARNKGKKINNYVVNKNKPLESFKTNVPDEVKNIFNFSELNVHHQLNKHFLVTSSSGEVARVLNKIINLESIDKAQSNIEQMKRGYKNEHDKIKKDIENKEIEIEKYDWIDAAEKRIVGLSKKETDLEEKKSQLEELSLIVTKLAQYDVSLKKYNNILKYEKQVNEAVKKHELLKVKQSHLNELNVVVEKIVINKKMLVELNKKTKYEKKVNDLLEKQEKIAEKVKYLKEFNLFLEDFKKNSYNKEEMEKVLEKLTLEYAELKPDTCPLCGGDFK